MKTVLTVFAALALSLSLQAQKIEPTIENAGSMVKGIFYHSNGLVAEVGYFKDGKFQGEWLTFDNIGNKIAQRQYEDGKRTGKWFFWNPSGEAFREVTYIDGRLQQVTVWNNAKSTR